ncbi:MAG TPA: hypothetical protein VFR60_00435, partial [Sphingomicrobium sp.]|nr:hypothetical protein [Sphingomicrobium sp.]
MASALPVGHHAGGQGGPKTMVEPMIGSRGPTAKTRGRRSYLQIEEVTKRFGAFTALERVSLEVLEGEFVCFL